MNLAIFASGNGTNAQRIIEYFKGSDKVKVKGIYSNNINAFVLTRAKNLDIASYTFDREDFYKTNKVLDNLINNHIDYIILAGFLWLVPQNILDNYANKIINIHPALLPKYGGKGMFGMHVHETVIKSGDKESGISIHLVNEKYDEGKIILQAKCSISDSDNAESLAVKIHQLEYEYFPKVIEQVVSEKINY